MVVMAVRPKEGTAKRMKADMTGSRNARVCLRLSGRLGTVAGTQRPQGSGVRGKEPNPSEDVVARGDSCA